MLVNVFHNMSICYIMFDGGFIMFYIVFIMFHNILHIFHFMFYYIFNDKYVDTVDVSRVLILLIDMNRQYSKEVVYLKNILEGINIF